ncbi:hypothetical protein DBA29_11785 [Xenophilus aerolatus]|nr:hypothetical protein [Xenophilus aerolatus]
MSEPGRRAAGRLRVLMLAACLLGGGAGALAQTPPAAPTPLLLRAGTEQHLIIDASGDPRLPHLFSVEGDAAAPQRRPWAVSLNVALEGAAELDRRLVQELAQRQMAGQVLLEEFRPPHVPRCTELQVGSRVPVAVVQAVVRALLPLPQRWSVQIVEDDESGTGESQRVYIGGMVQRPCALASPSRLRELAAPGLSLPELHRLLRTINGTVRQHAAAAQPPGGA